jgi:hypothetical protein
MALYKAFNGVAPTTAAQVAVTTGTAIKTLMQLSTPSTARIKVIAWGISFDGSAAATPIKCELVETDVAATVTAYTAATDLVKFDGGDPTSLLTVGTANSGFTGSAEGTITATREFDVQLVAPTGQYIYQFPLGQEPIVAVSKFLRVRVTAGTAVNAYCWICWVE